MQIGGLIMAKQGKTKKSRNTGNENPFLNAEFFGKGKTTAIRHDGSCPNRTQIGAHIRKSGRGR